MSLRVKTLHHITQQMTFKSRSYILFHSKTQNSISAHFTNPSHFNRTPHKHFNAFHLIEFFSSLKQIFGYLGAARKTKNFGKCKDLSLAVQILKRKNLNTAALLCCHWLQTDQATRILLAQYLVQVFLWAKKIISCVFVVFLHKEIQFLCSEWMYLFVFYFHNWVVLYSYLLATFPRN